MQFHEALKRVLVEKMSNKVIDRLVELYPNEEKNREGYEKVIAELAQMKPVYNEKCIIVVHEEEDWQDHHKYTSVSGRYPDTEDPDIKDELCAIEFNPWKEWLGYELEHEGYSLLDAVCHCLWEMTFCGYSNTEVKDRKDELMRRIKEADEHPERMIPMEDIFPEKEEKEGDL